MPFAVPVAAAFGLVIGSFLNVVAHRLPGRMSLSMPASHCPSCEAPIKPYDNIPVLSWLLLRGRCRTCSARISARYPLVEASTAILFAAVVAVHHADTAALVLGPAAVLAVVLGTALDPGGQVGRLIAGAAAGAVLGLPALISPKGMGMGDAKLVAVLGLYLGAAVAPAFFVAFLVGTAVGIAIIARKGMMKGRKTAVPFGPFLALGGVVGVLAGNELVQAYLSTF